LSWARSSSGAADGRRFAGAARPEAGDFRLLAAFTFSAPAAFAIAPVLFPPIQNPLAILTGQQIA
jgi:hypothetical protein